jgi:hypothetical protein
MHECFEICIRIGNFSTKMACHNFMNMNRIGSTIHFRFILWHIVCFNLHMKDYQRRKK